MTTCEYKHIARQRQTNEQETYTEIQKTSWVVTLVSLESVHQDSRARWHPVVISRLFPSLRLYTHTIHNRCFTCIWLNLKNKKQVCFSYRTALNLSLCFLYQPVCLWAVLQLRNGHTTKRFVHLIQTAVKRLSFPQLAKVSAWHTALNECVRSTFCMNCLNYSIVLRAQQRCMWSGWSGCVCNDMTWRRVTYSCILHTGHSSSF